MKWVALMPLRKGSKSIPGKNVRILAGRPLFSWSLRAAIRSGCFDEIYVATDDESAAALITRSFAGEVTTIGRSAATATDTAPTESVMLEFMQNASFDVLCLIQATSPLTTAVDFAVAKAAFLDSGFDSLLTVTGFARFLWDEAGSPLNYDPTQRPRRQDFGGCNVENGAFYFTTKQILRDEGCRLGGRIGLHKMPAETLLEIDEPGDWEIAEHLLRKRAVGTLVSGVTTRIKRLVVDVDGTLTDGGMYYGEGGERLKKFNTRDGKGLSLLQQAGIGVCIMTGEHSPAAAARADKLGITEYYPGVADKLGALEERAQSWGIDFSEIAFIGDDLGDLDCFTRVGVSFCPLDAIDAIKMQATYVCSRKGGEGAVREACDALCLAAAAYE